MSTGDGTYVPGPPPPFVTETNEPRWQDCTWASGLMGLCDVRPATPATRVEREAIRAAAIAIAPLVDPPGATLTELVRGLEARHAYRPTIFIGTFLELLAVLETAQGAVILGRYDGLPTALRLDPGFRDGHAAYGRLAGPRGEIRPGYLWWMDPLGRGLYVGQWVEASVIRRYAGAWAGFGQVHAAIFRRSVMLAVVTRTPFAAPRHWTIPAGAVLRGYDPARPGAPVKSAVFTSETGGWATARVGVAWPGVDAPPAPNGAPFLEVSAGPAWAGLLILEAAVSLDPEPPAALSAIVVLDTLQSAIDEFRAGM